MGCDIHLAVERRAAGDWEHRGYEGESPTEREDWYDGRNYSLFAILADVRNGFGVAGRDTGDRVRPIDDPRGLPDDATDETRASSDAWGEDGHSHSWLTLAEILAFDWDQRMVHRRWVRMKRGLPNPRDITDDQFAERIQESARVLGGLPSAESWGYETCSWSSEGQGASGWRTIEWSEPFWESAGPTWWGLVARMARLAGDDLEPVRIVFWFDN